MNNKQGFQKTLLICYKFAEIDFDVLVEIAVFNSFGSSLVSVKFAESN